MMCCDLLDTFPHHRAKSRLKILFFITAGSSSLLPPLQQDRPRAKKWENPSREFVLKS
jgi:hypothetical protein